MELQALYPFLFYILSAVAVILLVETVYLTSRGAVARKRGINRRLRSIDEGLAGEQVLVKLKAERGISGEGTPQFADWARLYLVQSGLRLTMVRFVLIVLATTAAVFCIIVLLSTLPLLYAVPIAAAAGAGIPILVVRIARSWRQYAFASQLPEALEVIVRSLRSGHPVQVSMAMVGRELPDPIGTEFGITLDEMTYGLDMERAFLNLGARVGHADLALVITAISLQASTGGNLIEVLSNLSRILRERFHLRRKVRALSAEGRFSAYGLTILPILLFLAIYLQNPGYYERVWNEPIFMPASIAIIVWGLVGNLIMYKMVNFRF